MPLLPHMEESGIEMESVGRDGSALQRIVVRVSIRATCIFSRLVKWLLR